MPVLVTLTAEEAPLAMDPLTVLAAALVPPRVRVNGADTPPVIPPLITSRPVLIAAAVVLVFWKVAAPLSTKGALMVSVANEVVVTEPI